MAVRSTLAPPPASLLHSIDWQSQMQMRGAAQQNIDVDFTEGRRRCSIELLCPPPQKWAPLQHRGRGPLNIRMSCSRFPLEETSRLSFRPENEARAGVDGGLLSAALVKGQVTFSDSALLSSPPQLDILCNEEILGKDHTLKFVVVTRWRFKVTSERSLRA